MTDFNTYNTHCKHWVTTGIENYLESRLKEGGPLMEAIRYGVLSGGKRVRAMLVHGACLLANGNEEVALPSACAVEFIHAYSLIHDDLPAMDNSDTRRGKPSCHKKFGEDVAILAGDALQSFAFEILATSRKLAPEIKLQQIAVLAKAAGAKGMVGGQSIDMAMTGYIVPPSLPILETMHKEKTGALISACLSMGAYATNASNEIHESLSIYGNAIGLAFQVRDDILDVTSDSQTLGKPQGSDLLRKKATYVTLMGLEEAGNYLMTLLEQANEALSSFKSEADPLRWIARFIVNRKY